MSIDESTQAKFIRKLSDAAAKYHNLHVDATPNFPGTAHRCMKRALRANDKTKGAAFLDKLVGACCV